MTFTDHRKQVLQFGELQKHYLLTDNHVTVKKHTMMYDMSLGHPLSFRKKSWETPWKNYNKILIKMDDIRVAFLLNHSKSQLLINWLKFCNSIA